MTAVDYHLEGRVVIVTGTSRRAGIGAGIARRLAAHGADLFLHTWAPADAEQAWGADEGGIEALLTELRRTGRRVEHLAADLADPEVPARLFDAAYDAFGSVDALVANHARSSRQALDEVTAAELDLSFAVNTRATVLLAKEFAARYRSGPDTPAGRVLLFTSGQHLGPMPEELPYIASKGANQQLAASLAAHLAPRGITVNCVNPGPVDTGYADDAAREAVRRHMPQGRWGEPDDPARLVAWLLSDDAQWVTGQTVNSEGGFTR